MPELQQRDDSGILAGMWGPPLAETLEVEGMEYLGEIQHVLSHRDMHIRVWRSEGAQGIDPSSVPLSSLDLKLLALAGLD